MQTRGEQLRTITGAHDDRDAPGEHRSDDRVHALERELASVVLHAADAIVTWRLDGTIASWNPSAERVYGVAATAAVGRAIDTIVPEVERSARIRT